MNKSSFFVEAENEMIWMMKKSLDNQEIKTDV